MVRRLKDHLIYDMWKVALEPAKARVVPVKDKISKPQGGTAYYALCICVHRALFYLERKIKMSKELAKTYDPKGLEDRLYKKWEENGYFHA